MIATLQRRDAWQVIDTVNQVTDPSTLADLAGYAPYLTTTRSASCWRPRTSPRG